MLSGEVPMLRKTQVWSKEAGKVQDETGVQEGKTEGKSLLW